MEKEVRYLPDINPFFQIMIMFVLVIEYIDETNVNLTKNNEFTICLSYILLTNCIIIRMTKKSMLLVTMTYSLRFNSTDNPYCRIKCIN